MNFPYPTVTNLTSSVNTAYYFNEEDVKIIQEYIKTIKFNTNQRMQSQL